MGHDLPCGVLDYYYRQSRFPWLPYHMWDKNVMPTMDRVVNLAVGELGASAFGMARNGHSLNAGIRMPTVEN
jgi:hypothetical protein